MILEIHNLAKSFSLPSGDIQILHGIELQVAKGKTIAILGQSGSGKSTFLSLLAGLDHPSQGEILVAGQSITTMTEDQLARFRGQHLGIIFQQYHLMANLTALENVCLPLDIAKVKNSESLARQALEQVGLQHRIDSFPSKLSGGECQRVAIARAFVTKPDILFADEPSGSLDDRTGEMVMDLIFNLSKEKQTTLILVTHNQLLADRCDQIYELKDASLHKIK